MRVREETNAGLRVPVDYTPAAKRPREGALLSVYEWRYSASAKPYSKCGPKRARLNLILISAEPYPCGSPHRESEVGRGSSDCVRPLGYRKPPK